MAVTYRSAGRERSDRRLSRRCRGCGSVHDMEIVRRDVVVVQVGDRTCPLCNPHTDGRESVPKSSFVKAWWTVTTGADWQWKIMCAATDKNVEYMPVPLPKTPAEQAVQGLDFKAWQEFATRSSHTDWTLLDDRWRPDHCAMVEALASAIDTMWTLIAPSARIVIRLTGLPALTESLLIDVLARWLIQERDRPLAELGHSLRELAVLACAGTAVIDSCRSAHRLLGAIPARPTPEIIEQLGIERATLALTSTVAMLSAGNLESVAPQAKDLPAAVASGEPADALHESSVRLQRLGEAPARVMAFGTQ